MKNIFLALVVFVLSLHGESPLYEEMKKSVYGSVEKNNNALFNTLSEIGKIRGQYTN